MHTAEVSNRGLVPHAQSTLSRALDGWRAIACLLVLFHHTGFWLHAGPISVWGFTGVHLFFVLSGYLLFRPFCKAMQENSPFRFNQYYLRRFLRIYPAYLLALLVYTVVRYMSGMHPPSAPNIFSHLLFAFNSSQQSEFFGINIAFWTLAIEAQFYVLLPVLAFLTYRSLRLRSTPSMFATSALFLCLGVSARFIELSFTTGPAHMDEPAIRFHTVFSFLDFFAAGMFIAAFEVSGLEFKKSKQWINGGLLTLGISLFLAANSWCTHAGAGDWMLVNNFWFLLGFPFVLCTGLAIILFTVIYFEGVAASLLAIPGLVYVGKVSYSVYLFHILVQLPLFKIFPLGGIQNRTVQTFCWGLISVVPTLLVSSVTYRLVEAPFLKLADRFRTLRFTRFRGGSPAGMPSLPTGQNVD